MHIFRVELISALPDERRYAPRLLISGESARPNLAPCSLHGSVTVQDGITAIEDATADTGARSAR